MNIVRAAQGSRSVTAGGRSRVSLSDSSSNLGVMDQLEEHFEGEGPVCNPTSTFRENFFRLMDQHSSSFWARVISYFMFVIIIISFIIFLLRSMPEYWPIPPLSIWIVEGICIGIFIIDYVLRFILTPKKWEWVRGYDNFIDLLAIVPFVVDAGLTAHGAREQTSLRIVRLLELFRIFKLGKYNVYVGIVGKTFRRSKDATLLLVFLLAVFMTTASTLLFYAEQTEEYFDETRRLWIRKIDNEPSPFQSVIHCLWWCVVTMTSTGYGDIVPQTNVGKLIAGLTMVLGVMVLTFPITIFSVVFNDAWREVTQLAATRKAERRRLRKRTTLPEAAQLLRDIHKYHHSLGVWLTNAESALQEAQTKFTRLSELIVTLEAVTMQKELGIAPQTLPEEEHSLLQSPVDEEYD